MESFNRSDVMRCKVMPVVPNSQKENNFSNIISSDSFQSNYKNDILQLGLIPLILPTVLS